MYITSVLIFLESCIKCRPRAIEAEIKQLMSAQLKTHLAVCRVVVEQWPRKWLFGKRMFNFEFKVMQAWNSKNDFFMF